MHAAQGFYCLLLFEATRIITTTTTTTISIVDKRQTTKVFFLLWVFLFYFILSSCVCVCIENKTIVVFFFLFFIVVRPNNMTMMTMMILTTFKLLFCCNRTNLFYLLFSYSYRCSSVCVCLWVYYALLVFLSPLILCSVFHSLFSCTHLFILYDRHRQNTKKERKKFSIFSSFLFAFVFLFFFSLFSLYTTNAHKYAHYKELFSLFIFNEKKN